MIIKSVVGYGRDPHSIFAAAFKFDDLSTLLSGSAPMEGLSGRMVSI
jgi:hypothetical protein